VTVKEGVGWQHWAEPEQRELLTTVKAQVSVNDEPLFATPEQAQLYKLATNAAQLAAVAEEALNIAESWTHASYDNRKAMRKRVRQLRNRMDELVPED